MNKPSFLCAYIPIHCMHTLKTESCFRWRWSPLSCLMVMLAGTLFSTACLAETINCQGGNASVCGISIPFPDVTAIGNSTEVHVPASVLGDSYSANSNLHFRAVCVGDSNGGATYRVVDADQISCNAFPCPTSSVRLCDTSISVQGGTPLGGIVHMTMPLPFHQNGFTVQCLGNGDHPAAYQITDHAQVSCSRS